MNCLHAGLYTAFLKTEANNGAGDLYWCCLGCSEYWLKTPGFKWGWLWLGSCPCLGQVSDCIDRDELWEWVEKKA